MGEGLVRIAKLLPKFFFKSPTQGVSLKFLSTPLNSSQLLSIPSESEVLLPICYQIFDGVPEEGCWEVFCKNGLVEWCLTVKN